jgi:hypothetical protein
LRRRPLIFAQSRTAFKDHNVFKQSIAKILQTLVGHDLHQRQFPASTFQGWWKVNKIGVVIHQLSKIDDLSK